MAFVFQIRLINPDSPYVQEISSQLFEGADFGDIGVILASQLETEAALIFGMFQLVCKLFNGSQIYQ